VLLVLYSCLYPFSEFSFFILCPCVAPLSSPFASSGFFFSSSPVLLFSPCFFFLSPSHSLCFPFLLPSAGASLCLWTIFVSYLAKLEKFTWKQDEDNGVLWTALFLFSLAFPLINSFFSFAFPSYWYIFFFTLRLSLLPEC